MSDMSSYDAIVKNAKQALYMRLKSDTVFGKVEALVEQLRNDPSFASWTDEQLEEYASSQVDPTYILAAELKSTGEYSKFTDDELQDYAKHIINSRIAQLITNLDKNHKKDITKPEGSFWSQFTAEEILGMYYDGVVSIPKEYLEWATAEMNTDVMSYEIDDNAATSESDISSLEVVDPSTLDQKKKVQKFSSKTDAQEELLDEKNNEVQNNNKQINQEQNKLLEEQQSAIQKINSYNKELENLEKKIENGEELTSTELNRYEKLGELLSEQCKNISKKANVVESDIKDLFENVKDLNSLVDISNQMSSSLETMSRSYGPNEVAISPRYIQNNYAATGKMKEYMYNALSQKISDSAIATSHSLNNITTNTILNNRLSAQLKTQTADLVKNTIDIAQQEQNNSPIKDTNSNNQTEKQTENEHANQVNNETGSESNIVSEENLQEDTINLPEVDVVENEEEISADTTPSIDDETATLMDYLETSNEKIGDVQAYREQFNQALDVAKDINKRAFFDNIQFKSSFRAKILEYNRLQQEIKNSEIKNENDISKLSDKKSNIDLSADILEGSIDLRMKNLNNFNEVYDAGLETNNENIKYGTEVLNAGLTYIMNTNHVNPEIGISVGDVIESEDNTLGAKVVKTGANLINEANTTLKELEKKQNTKTSAEQTLNQLSELEANTSNERLTASNSVDLELNKKRSEIGLNDEEQKTKERENGKDVVSDKEKNKDADANDIKTIGKQADKQAGDANADNAKAKSDENKANRENRSNVSKIKKNENKIKKLNKDSDKNIKLANKLDSKSEQLADELEQIQEENEEQIARDARNDNENAKNDIPKTAEETNEPIEKVVQIPDEITEAEDGEVVLPTVTPSKKVSKRMNSVGNATGAAASPVQNQSSSVISNNQARANDITTQLAGIQSQNANINKSVAKNNKTVKNVAKNTRTLDKKIQQNFKVQEARLLASKKKAEADAKEDRSTTQKVSQVAKEFGYMKYTGMAMMMLPEPSSKSAGTILFKSGMYGEMTCYATNTGLYAAEGNLVGAATSMGSAALSYSGAATSVGNAAGKVAENAVKSTVEETAKKAAVETVKDGTTALVSAGMEAGKNALMKEAEKSETKDDATDNRRRTLVRFEREKLNKLNKSVKRVNKTARLKG